MNLVQVYRGVSDPNPLNFLLSLKQVLLGVLLLCSGILGAQTPTVSLRGTVISRIDGEALPGAAISVNGKGIDLTNADGKFQVQVPKGSEISFTFVGYQPHRFKADRNETTLTVYLENDQKDLNEVVVTALGIKREEKALGYSVSTIKEDQLTQAMPNNWSDAIKGKVAGLNILQTGSGPLNSARINLRGDRSLDPNKNEALIVVDGIPMINGKVSSGVDQAYGAGEYASKLCLSVILSLSVIGDRHPSQSFLGLCDGSIASFAPIIQESRQLICLEMRVLEALQLLIAGYVGSNCSTPCLPVPLI